MVSISVCEKISDGDQNIIEAVNRQVLSAIKMLRLMTTNTLTLCHVRLVSVQVRKTVFTSPFQIQ